MNRTKSPSLGQEMVAEIPLIAAAIRHPLPLFITSGAAVWAGAHTGQSVPLTLAYTLFAYLLSLLAVIDAKHGILPHILTLTLATLGTLLAPTLGISYWDSTLAALTAYLTLGAMALLTTFLTGKPALGGGDLTLTLAISAWLGLSGLPMFLMATAGTGIASIVLKRAYTRIIHAGYPTHGSGGPGTFAFGPALCAAGWLALLYSQTYWQIIELIVSPN